MADATVVITCYNLERYIGGAIESVLAQNFGGDLDIIVVDDCSTDGSAEVASRYPEVRLLRTARNSGVLLATILGVEAARSDVLFFLDGDDLWEPGKVAAVLPKLAEPQVALVTHDLSYVGPDGAVLDRRSRCGIEMGSVPAEEWPEKVRRGILRLDDYVWLGSAFAIRASAAQMDGFVRFARSLPDPANTYQDWPLAYWIASQRDVKLCYVPQKLFRYRLHQLNYSGDARTVDLLIRNLTRTLNTNLAILSVAAARSLPPAIVRIVRQRARFTAYLLELARGRRLTSVLAFCENVSELRRRRLFCKELARLVGTIVLGPQRFVSLASRRKTLRNLPVS